MSTWTQHTKIKLCLCNYVHIDNCTEFIWNNIKRLQNYFLYIYTKQATLLYGLPQKESSVFMKNFIFCHCSYIRFFPVRSFGTAIGASEINQTMVSIAKVILSFKYSKDLIVYNYKKNLIMFKLLLICFDFSS